MEGPKGMEVTDRYNTEERRNGGTEERRNGEQSLIGRVKVQATLFQSSVRTACRVAEHFAGEPCSLVSVSPLLRVERRAIRTLRTLRSLHPASWCIVGGTYADHQASAGPPGHSHRERRVGRH